MRIEPAGTPDFESICALLRAADPPIEGVGEHLGTALVAREDGGIVGCVALELDGEVAVLRSLAVEQSRRRRGLGRSLVAAALSLGRRRGVETFCLLTTTATEFFARHFAFRTVARAAVPPSVRESVEFVSACPAPAMMLDGRADMAGKPCVLFLCTHNSARSQLAEALLRHRAGDRYRACSAGVEPGRVHPLTLRVLEEAGVDTTGLHSKSLNDVLGRSNVRVAIVVCAQAAEVCPRLHPFAREVLRWPFDDPSRVQGPEELHLAAFRRTRDEIDARLRDWLSAR